MNISSKEKLPIITVNRTISIPSSIPNADEVEIIIHNNKSVIKLKKMKTLFTLLLLAFALHSSAQTAFIKPEAVQVVTAGSTVTVTNGVGLLRVNPASTLAALAVTFPSTPNDRDVLIMTFGGTLTSGTVVTLLSFVGSTIGTLPTTALTGSIMWMYDASTAKWYRLF